MSKDFYYSLSINTEEGSMKFTIDNNSVFKIKFVGISKKQPKIKSLPGGEYEIFFPNAYPSTDIKYIFDSDKVKEFITLKNASSPNEIVMEISLEKCVLFEDKKTKNIKILGQDQVELFSFDYPVIIKEEHNKNNFLEKSISMKIENIEPSKFTIRYLFNKDLMEKSYPINIDPTFIFNTRINRNVDIIKNDFNAGNFMYITGKSTANKFVDEAKKVRILNSASSVDSVDDIVINSDNFSGESNKIFKYKFLITAVEDGSPDSIRWSNDGGETFYDALADEVIVDNGISVYFQNSSGHSVGDFWSFEIFKGDVFISDSIIFEKNMRIIFPYIFSDVESVSIKTMQGNNEIVNNYNTISSAVTSEGNTYYYVDQTLLTSSPTNLVVQAFIKLSPNVYGDFTIAYERKLSYIPNINIEISNPESNLITNSDDPIRIKFNKINISHQNGLKPQITYILPYYLNYQFDSFENDVGVPIETFLQTPKISDQKSSKIIRSEFENVEYSDENFLTLPSAKYFHETIPSANRSSSFYNLVDIITQVDVNERNNAEQSIRFLKSYKFIHPDDFIFLVDGSEARAYNNEILSKNNYFNLYLVQKSSLYFERTQFEYVTGGLMKDKENIGEEHIYLKWENKPTLFAQNFMDNATWTYIKHSNNNFLGSTIIIEDQNGIFRNFKILRNTANSITIKGSGQAMFNIVSNLRRFAIIHYSPTHLLGNPSGKTYRNFKKILSINSFTNKGNIIYNPVKIDLTENEPTSIGGILIDEKIPHFSIIKPITVAQGSTFVYSETIEDNYEIKVGIDTRNPNSGAGIKGSLTYFAPFKTFGTSIKSVAIPKENRENILNILVKTSRPANQSTLKARVYRNNQIVAEISPIYPTSPILDNQEFEILFAPAQYTNWDYIDIYYEPVEKNISEISDVLKEM